MAVRHRRHQTGGSILKKLGKAIKQGAAFVKKHKLISRAAKEFSDVIPKAGEIQKIAEAVGAGRKRLHRGGAKKKAGRGRASVRTYAM